ncbi:MAG: hypothetical protein ACE5GK_10840 [Nitrospiria bacterium]
MLKRIRKAVIYISILVMSIPTAMAWDNETTHRDLSEVAAERSALGNGYLQNVLGINAGLGARLHWDGGKRKKQKSILEWLQDGGEFEDDSGRFFNHFHNPLRPHPWSDAGLNDSVLGFSFTGGSALLWAQNAGTLPDPNLDWSWQAVRGYFHQALTAPVKTDRDAFLAQTFRGLGNQIHLIQDMSQPAHVRNDAHPEDPFGVIPFTTIRWIERLENWAKINKDTALTFMNAPSIFPDVSLDSSRGALIPIVQFWDTDQYDGTAGTLPLTGGTTVGLAEHTNAHFFSDDTINASRPRHQFPFPSVRIEDYAICADVAPPGSRAERRWYISRTPCSAASVDHFLASSFLPAPKPTEISPSTQLDDRVYEDYARQLLPRAVGYSAALLDYFFRGELSAVPVAAGIAVRNGGTETLGLDPATGLAGGTLEVYYDDAASIRRLLATHALTVPLAPTDPAIVVPFVHPTDNTAFRRYIVVYRGPLGAEQDAVIGKVTAQQIYFVREEAGTDGLLRDKIYRMNPDGSGKTLIYDNADADIHLTGLAVSPDGRTLAFVPLALTNPPLNPTIQLLNIKSGSLMPLTAGAFPAWSPDGTRIAFRRASLPPSSAVADLDIVVRDIATGIETPLTPSPHAADAGLNANNNSQPAWAPDGNSLAFSRSKSSLDPKTTVCSPGSILYRMDLSGKLLGPLSCVTTALADADTAPGFRPDGGEIVFTRKLRAGLPELYKVTVEANGIGTQTKLTDSDGTSFVELFPAWSLDASFILIESGRDGDIDLWRVDPNGAGYRDNLTDDNPNVDAWPAFGWMP